MKLFRFGPIGAEKPGVVIAGPSGADVLVDASAFAKDWDEHFFGHDGLRASPPGSWRTARGAARPGRRTPRSRRGAAEQDRLHRPQLSRPRQGEAGAAIPSEPIVFMKASSAWQAAGDDLVLPRGSVKTDWEVELAFVIGKRASYVTSEAALDHVAGYALHNDYSEREWQLERNGQWAKGKGADGFAALGPYLVTREAFPTFGHARLWLDVNGAREQDSNTNDLIFDVPTLVSYLSRFMTLLPGDVVSTGTPAGVGMGHKPPVFLKAGDVVEYGIEGLGQARQRIVAGAAP